MTLPHDTQGDDSEMNVSAARLGDSGGLVTTMDEKDI
jgi:hypothetical protein